MDYTFLCKVYGVLKKEMWQSMNDALSGYAQPDIQRGDGIDMQKRQADREEDRREG